LLWHLLFPIVLGLRVGERFLLAAQFFLLPGKSGLTLGFGGIGPAGIDVAA